MSKKVIINKFGRDVLGRRNVKRVKGKKLGASSRKRGMK